MIIELVTSLILGLIIGAIISTLIFGFEKQNIPKDVAISLMVAIGATIVTATWKIRSDIASIRRQTI